jgi:hypothetical protein
LRQADWHLLRPAANLTGGFSSGYGNRMVQETSAAPPAEPARHHWAIPHVAAAAFAIAAYFAIYSVTGDSDLLIALIALATGGAGGYLTWIVIEVEFWLRSRKHGQATARNPG